MNFKQGKRYVCLTSSSCGYKKDVVYECYLNSKGKTCLKGSDGYEDMTSMLVSTFREVREEYNN